MPDLAFKPFKGLYRSPAQIMAPAGSMQLARNVVFRRVGVVEPIPAIEGVGADFDDELFRMLDTGTDYVLGVASNFGAFETKWVKPSDGTAVVVTLNGAAPAYEVGRFQLSPFRGRQYWTSKSSVLEVDAAGNATARRAGLPSPTYAAGATTPTDGRALAANTTVNYVAVFRRNLADGSFVISAPSNVVTVPNGGFTANVNVTVAWAAGLELNTATDFIEVYRTKSVPNGTEPGGTFFLAVKRKLTTAASPGSMVILDVATDNELDAELYTNDGQKGAVKANLPPPHANDIVFYRGAMFVIAAQERQSITVRVSGLWSGAAGLTTDPDRTYGIGLRNVTGNTMIGNPIITGVSASHLKGIVPFQRVSSAQFPAGTTVVSTGVGTITVSAGALATTVGTTHTMTDVIKINATTYDVTTFVEDVRVDPLRKLMIRKFPFVNDTSGVSLSIASHFAGADVPAFTLQATNGQNFTPTIPAPFAATALTSDPDVRGNRIAWSEPDQPEHWPIVNRAFVGEGVLQRLIVAGDAIYAFNTDGVIYRISGIGGDDWRSDPVIVNTRLAVPNATVGYGPTVYALTDKGILAFGDGGVRNLTSERLAADFKGIYVDLAPPITDPFTWNGNMLIDRFHRELWFVPSQGVTEPWIYNIDQDEWSNFRSAVGASGVCRGAVYHEGTRRVVFAIKSGDISTLKRFVAFDSNAIYGDVHMTLNRMDADETGVLKNWREFVLAFGASNIPVSMSMLLTMHTDAAMGSTPTTTTHAIILPDDAGSPVTFPIGRNAGMGTQWWIEMEPTADGAWRLEAGLVRVDSLVDRTGRRAA